MIGLRFKFITALGTISAESKSKYGWNFTGDLSVSYLGQPCMWPTVSRQTTLSAERFA